MERSEDVKRSEDGQDHPETSGATHQAAIPGAIGPEGAKTTTTTEEIPKSAPKRRSLDPNSEGEESDIDDIGLVEELADLQNRFESLKRQSLPDPNVQPLVRRTHRGNTSTQEAAPEEALVLEQARAVLGNEDDDDPEAVGPGTTLVASDSTAKTPKIKNDKTWEALCKKIMAEARNMGFEPELSTDNQTIQVLNADKKEQMRVERQADNTLKLSSEQPTTITPEHLIRLFLVTGSKTCNLKNAESAKVAAELYQKLTKQNIEVTLSPKVLEQLQSDSRYEKIAEEYLRKNPSPARPTSRSRVIPPTQSTGSKVQPDKADTTEPSKNAAADPAHDADKTTRSTSPRR